MCFCLYCVSVLACSRVLCVAGHVFLCLLGCSEKRIFVLGLRSFCQKVGFTTTKIIRILIHNTGGTGFVSDESSSLWFLEELSRNEEPSRWIPDLF